ncbi:hypothetical protein GE09DRAFT_130922 [Coniochaeta sp. 2T2.1]|nr:hypothetical protein GE09DRAFT_130922 [Coniochaeta sp. 2T2.1]
MSRVFVLVDALDEYDDRRSRFLESLYSLQGKHGINLFATSRDIRPIVKQFENFPQVEIRATDQDVRAHLEGCLESHDGELPTFIQRSQQHKQAIVDTITEAADRIPYVISIKDKMTP